jgi:hypothetical protein
MEAKQSQLELTTKPHHTAVMNIQAAHFGSSAGVHRAVKEVVVGGCTTWLKHRHASACDNGSDR